MMNEEQNKVLNRIELATTRLLDSANQIVENQKKQLDLLTKIATKLEVEIEEEENPEMKANRSALKKLNEKIYKTNGGFQ